jgi:cardiolipin synthase (CMP-forming)
LAAVARSAAPGYISVILSLADWFSVARIPLGVAFLAVADRALPAMAVLVAAGATDVLDGWAARRRLGPRADEPHRGDWLDPFCDKVFVAAVLAGIYAAHRPPVLLLVLTASREILQVLSVAIYKLVPAIRRGLRYNYRAHVVGKATTICQFATAAALTLEHPAATPLAWATAALGLASVAVYLNRARALGRAAR